VAEAERAPTRERWWWLAGIVFVVAVVADVVVAAGIPLDQNSSAAKIARELDAHSADLIAISCICAVYAIAFPVYLTKLHRSLRTAPGASEALASLVLVGGVLLVALHAISDVAITGLLGGKLAVYGARHDHGVSYAFYLLTFAISSLGDLFGSLFMAAAGVLALRSRVLPTWLAVLALVAAVFLFAQGFGLGGAIATFGLVFDLIGFGLFLVFVFSTSLVLLRREHRLRLSRSQVGELR
jgi:hypothetical protein